MSLVPVAFTMSSVAKTLTAVFLLLMACQSLPSQGGRYAIGSDEFTVSYRADDDEYAQAAYDAAEEAIRRLKLAFGIEHLEGRIQIELCHDYAEFKQRTGQDVGPWVDGMAFPRQRRIVIRRVGLARMGKLVGHELCHVLLAERLEASGATAPRWLHEGLAKYSTGDLSIADRQILIQAAADNRLLDISELDKAFSGKVEQVGLAYAESYVLVEFLAEHDQGGGVGALIEALGRTDDINAAVERACGLPMPVLQKRWLKAMRDKYIRQAVPPQAELVIFTAMGVLFLAAVVVRWRQRIIIRRRMQEEELLQALMMAPVAGAGQEHREPDTRDRQQ